MAATIHSISPATMAASASVRGQPGPEGLSLALYTTWLNEIRDQPVWRAKADKWKIRPGQRYRCLVFRDGRDLVTQRARLDMDSLCQKHDLYDDA